jgi:eukaryotic-like serine/threonine-protein kinase
MSLSIGLRLGPYEIQAPAGAGGMGEVYKAVDTRLKRTVAIKVLPHELTASVEARQRLEREARSISKLTHPHICTLYDFGQQDSVEFLVMEYLEGETLERRLQRGPLPIAQVLTYAIQIAGALDKAHHVGIIHRDLKPSNIMLTKEGAKLLDFGLAKVQRTQGSVVDETLTDLTTDQKNLTDKGVILGTFQYMAPEQLEGKEADERTDIFALGAVIYEMVTGKPPFAGKSRASLIAAILASEPVPITTLKAMTPPSLDRVVKVCLAKDADERWQWAHDLKIELSWIAEASSTEEPFAVTRRIRRERLAWVGVVSALCVFFIAMAYRQRSVVPPPMVQFAIQAPEGHTIADDAHTLAISPDGRKLVLLARDAEDKTSLWLRSLGSVSAHQLPGTEGSDIPVWSPDSRWLLFVSEGKVKKIDTNGGLPEVLCDAKATAVLGWNGQSTALLSFSLKGSATLMPIQQLGLDDCVVKPATILDRSRYNVGQQWSRFLPDGRHFLYSGLRNNRKHDVLLASLGSQASQVLISNASDAKYVSPGYLLFERNGFLMGQTFDVRKLRLSGEPIQVLPEQLAFGSYSGSANYDASDTGVLVYHPIPQFSGKLVLRDSKGTPLRTLSTGLWLWAMRVAPTGKLIFSKQDPQAHTSDLWMFDLQKNDWQRLTFDTTTGGHVAVFSPDGKQIIYAAVDKAAFQLHRKALGADQVEVLGNSDLDQVPTDWSSDGRFLLFTQTDTNGAGDLWAMPMNANQHPYPLTQTRFDEHDASFSPDGRWITYSSDESGKPEVYVASFSTPQDRFQISSGGGQAPRWNRQGNRIYYMAQDGKVMEVPLKIGSRVDATSPTLLFQAPPRAEYAILPDGKFVTLENTYNGSSAVATLNWYVGANIKH